MAGVAADDGHILWKYPDWTVPMAAVASPLVIGEDRIFLCGGYGAGSMMLKLEKSGDGIRARSLYTLPPEGFGAEQHTPIYHEGYIYGVKPGGELVCLDENGKTLWTSGKKRFGSAGYILADGRCGS